MKESIPAMTRLTTNPILTVLPMLLSATPVPLHPMTQTIHHCLVGSPPFVSEMTPCETNETLSSYKTLLRSYEWCLT